MGPRIDHRSLDCLPRIGACVRDSRLRDAETPSPKAPPVAIAKVGQVKGSALNQRRRPLTDDGGTGPIAITESMRKLVEGYFTLKALGPARANGVGEARKSMVRNGAVRITRTKARVREVQKEPSQKQYAYL